MLVLYMVWTVVDIGYIMKNRMKFFCTFLLFGLITCKNAAYEIIAPAKSSSAMGQTATGPASPVTTPAATTATPQTASPQPASTTVPPDTTTASQPPQGTPLPAAGGAPIPASTGTMIPAPNGGPTVTLIPGTSLPAMPAVPLSPFAHVITKTGSVVLVNPLFVSFSCLKSSVAYYWSPCHQAYTSCLQPAPPTANNPSPAPYNGPSQSQNRPNQSY